jgi:hypothetical protein
MPQKPQVRAKQKRRRTKKLADWRSRQESTTSKEADKK